MRISWEELAECTDQLQQALVALALVSAPGHLEYFGERSAITFSKEPGVLGERTLTFGVRENGTPAYEVQFTQRLHRLDSQASGLD